MISIRYSYLILALLFILGWLFLYWRRKNERPELVALSFALAAMGIGADILYVKDWWYPLTVLGSAPVSGEALLAAFGIVGVAATLPEYVLRLKDTSPGRIFTPKEKETFFITFFTMAALFYGSFFLLHINSLISTIIAFLIPTAFMWGSRRDLIKVAVLNGIFLVLFSIVVYGILDFLTPGWIDAFYLFKNTPRVFVFTVPIDDAIFYLCTGLFLGTFYEWWQGVRRIPIREGHRSVVLWWARWW